MSAAPLPRPAAPCASAAAVAPAFSRRAARGCWLVHMMRLVRQIASMCRPAGNTHVHDLDDRTLHDIGLGAPRARPGSDSHL